MGDGDMVFVRERLVFHRLGVGQGWIPGYVSELWDGWGFVLSDVCSRICSAA